MAYTCCTQVATTQNSLIMLYYPSPNATFTSLFDSRRAAKARFVILPKRETKLDLYNSMREIGEEKLELYASWQQVCYDTATLTQTTKN
jgi:hypothetical protein